MRQWWRWESKRRSHDPSSEEALRPGRTRPPAAVWVLALCVLDLSLEHSLVVPALPAIGQHFAATPTEVAWIYTAFLVALAVSTALAGRLGDSFGRRRVLMLSLLMFAFGSLVSALSDSIAVLVAGRVVQGFGAGVGPLATALARDNVAPGDVPRAVGMIVGAAGIGGVAGLLVAGRLVDWFSPSAIFWALVVVALALLVAVVTVVPESPVRTRTSVDWLGAGLLAAALTALMLAVSQGNAWGWGSRTVVGLFAGAALLLLAFAARQRTASAPLFNLELLAQPAVVTANVATFAVGFGLFVAYALVPLIAGFPQATGYGLGLNTTRIGLLLLPGGVAALVGGHLGGGLVARIGARHQALLGVLAAGAGYLLLVVVAPTWAVIAAAMILIGGGIALAVCALVSVVILSTDPAHTGALLGVNSLIRSVATALGVQIAVAVLTAAPEVAPGLPSLSGFTNAFVFAGGVALLAAVTLVPLPGHAMGARPTEPAPVPAGSGGAGNADR